MSQNPQKSPLLPEWKEEDYRQMNEWLQRHRITEVECLIPDLTGIARGKIMPADKFLRKEGLRLPENLFLQTVTGDWVDEKKIEALNPADGDMNLQPDPSTICLVPWAQEPTAQVIHDCLHMDRSAIEISPRNVLRRVLSLYEKEGWGIAIAPELEFYLTKINKDPDYPLAPPVGRSGRPEATGQFYGIDALNEFDPLFEDMYDYCEAQQLDIDALTHEMGPSQMEINFIHGDPLRLADHVYLFKRTMRETAFRHKVYATFMAKPMANLPGSALHLHQSLFDLQSKHNLFADEVGKHTPLFLSFIAGLQTYLPEMMLMIGPNVNSYRRIIPNTAAPINVHWGVDNRTVGLRVPFAEQADMRVENRLPGADANPYLAMAASLGCGYLGIRQGLQPDEPLTDSAYYRDYSLPRSLSEAVALFEDNPVAKELFGEKFVQIYSAVKRTEYEAFFQVISTWEREFLLLNV